MTTVSLPLSADYEVRCGGETWTKEHLKNRGGFCFPPWFLKCEARIGVFYRENASRKRVKKANKRLSSWLKENNYQYG
jgi:hypothetical protein